MQSRTATLLDSTSTTSDRVAARSFVTLDGNHAAADVAYRASEVIAIYPITPASTMGELSDEWSAAGRRNLFGSLPRVIEMQSEAGAAGAVHGALQGGSLATTFTASQGLLLMIPEMYKIAGQLLPAVIHVAARTVATHALSIFGDHGDVMAARATGWAILASGSVQEAQDLAAVAHAATLRASVPFLHFFDGFRTSHEIAKIEPLADEALSALLEERAIAAFRKRALSPERPVLRGSAQNPDVFFQAREAANPFYLELPRIVQEEMDRLARLCGRRYRLFDYAGHPEAERVVVVMGSGADAVRAAVEHLAAAGARVGLLQVRLFRPLDARALAAALPASVRRIAVLDRVKEPGAAGEPLYQDVVVALAEAWREVHGGPGVPDVPDVMGGRFGLSSKEFTPAMAIAVFEELARAEPKRHFTVGIVDDVTHTSLVWDRALDLEPEDVLRAVFWGLGSDGTVGASKSTVEIAGESTPLFAQGYFVYDSKKAGSVTVSHLRFSPRPIRAPWLVKSAGFVSCGQFHLLERYDVLETARPGAIFLLNSPWPAREVWAHLPREVQERILELGLHLWVVDAHRVAREAGLAGRINTALQACFFALSGLLPREEAIDALKRRVAETYAKRGGTVVQRNQDAIDRALSGLREVEIPPRADSKPPRAACVPESAPDFVQRVTARILAGQGELLPVSALPPDGTFPLGTARYERRSIAHEIPIWDESLCTQCALCPLVCPHAAIRMKPFPAERLEGAPEGFRSLPRAGADEGWRMTIQVAPDDCTGCGICAEVCPARSKESAKHKALDMQPKGPHLERERAGWEFYLALPSPERRSVDMSTLKGSQSIEPLFEFSGACAGCGETPYLKLLTQLFGDRLVVANATGCSSIYGGNLPTTPWSAGSDGRGPAWANSLFEDNAEFGLGIRLAADQQRERARELLRALAAEVGEELAGELLACEERDDAEIAAQRARQAELKRRLAGRPDADSRQLHELCDALLRRSVWIVGGDGWAYDIGFGGLDHVLASGLDVNLLVLDTEVYSNTGGQASKATPRGAVAKFASQGKPGRAKDLGLIAMTYGSVYVAQVVLGANPLQTQRAFQEAESWRGPSLIIAYSHCVAHGIDMRTAMGHQREAVQSGYRPLYRFDPRSAAGGSALRLDSKRPRMSFREFAAKEARFALLPGAAAERAGELAEQAQRDIDERWQLYERMAAPARPTGANGERGA
jgi:pyruvate-ferredoxin/flavodoxin oxidoreductase